MSSSNVSGAGRPLVIGIGNRLLRDDAAGPLVLERLQAHAGLLAAAGDPGLLDGGTLGLSLLPEIEACSGLIAVDAARFGATPGTVRVFEGGAMDAQATGRKHSVHEVALADLLGAAALQGLLPERRALVAVEPESTELGLEPTAAVQAALPALCAEVLALLHRWAAMDTQPACPVEAA